ncbi:MAG: AAA domain-containing protein [Streptosporangiaceae bacterium]
MTAAPLAALADRATDQVIADLGVADRAIVVDSPPGAGKSALVVRAARVLAGAGEPVMVVAQTNGQVDDLVDRLASAAAIVPGSRGLAVGRLCAQDYTPSPRVSRHACVTVSTDVADLAGCAVVAGTAAKWAAVRAGTWSCAWAVVDEAYQMRSDLLLRIAGQFDRALFVGDPGQLDPFSTVDIDRWAGLTWDPMQSAVEVLLRHNPDVVVRRLPVSWRLPASAVPVVADAFYPFGGFAAGSAPGERRLAFSSSALWRGEPVDAALSLAAETGWALYELPARHTVRTDSEAVRACAALAERLLQRGCVAYSRRAPRGAVVTADRIAIGTAHRDQARAIRHALGPGLAAVTVDTANRLQGREFDVMIVLHPLSGRVDATAFHLEAGRLCVLTSRHRHACIVVARAGIPELLDAYPSTEPVHLNVPAKFPDGWEANQAVMAHLTEHRVTVR